METSEDTAGRLRLDWSWEEIRLLVERLISPRNGLESSDWTRLRLKMDIKLEENLEEIIAAVARDYAQEGDTVAVAVLASSKPSLQEVDWDNYNQTTSYEISFQVSARLVAQIKEQRERIETSILEKVQQYGRLHPGQLVRSVGIIGELVKDPKWREKAMDWIEGKGITNQGRVRSDNIASKSCDGLLFRSQPEILLYRALKNLGVSFAPLPVFVRGGETYSRIEPDFILVRQGVILHVEVDGDTVHTETPAEAHARTAILLHEGVHVERLSASVCDTPEKAAKSAKRLVELLDRHKGNR